MSNKKLIPSKNSPEQDRVYTPQKLADEIIRYFKPKGRVIEPSAGPVGKQSFVSAILNYSTVKFDLLDWRELDEGFDFLSINPADKHYDWSIGNWPYSKFRAFLNKNMEVADNIVTLSPINHIMGLKARLRDMKEHNFYIREILMIDTPKTWASSGFQYAANYLSKENGDCKISYL